MLFRRHGTFSGGIGLPDEKEGLVDGPILPAPRCPRLLVPLAPCGGVAARPLVSPGQRVYQGRKIAEAADGWGVDVFAPLSGVVKDIGIANLAGQEGFVSCPAIELEDLEDPQLPTVEMPLDFDWRSLEPAMMEERLAGGGLTTQRLPVLPLAAWLERARSCRCDTLIANVVEGQPYVTSDHRLLAESGKEVVEGLAIIGRAMGNPRMVLAVDERRTGHYRRVIGSAENHDVGCIAVSHKYPAGADIVLASLLTRRAAPQGGDTMDAGVAVVNAAVCHAVRQWAVCGQPPTHRVVTVAGDGISHPGNYWTPLGVSCAALAGAGDHLVHGGPMTGLRCVADAVVGPATDAVLRIESDVSTASSQCIRCGWCVDHCPVRLNVSALNDDFELGQVRHAARAGSMRCVECGVCGYVCPARLPLRHRVRQLKKALAVIGEETVMGSSP